ncbi:hypothetical protein M413DRAFT_78124 [Hebeloma cylindrosporum]|uniref:Uncharacterized protein n=1 Tax=Hebeloma cylindrosporum TaxID=76867 RepID=A0A0C2XF05_HEBCY|nr:hypothetical protein M413DRAFT_78124 [Hebeloma cylindrosporum h7]
MPPWERPMKIFRNAFKDLAGKLTFTEDLFMLTQANVWDPQFVNIGYLHIPDWRSQVRMHYFANCVDTIRHIQPVLTMAIEHRLTFQVGVLASDFHFFNTEAILKIDQRLLKEMYKPGFTETPLTYTSPSTFLTSYLGKVANVLHWPHAHAFIGLGGPYSWLTQRWEGDNLITKFMSGPSLQVTRHFKGQSDSAEDNYLGIHWDTVSAQESEFLLGFIPADKSNPERWLYLPVAILDEHCDHFRHIMSQITRTPPTTTPKSRRGWGDFLHSYNRGRKAPKFIPSERHFSDASVRVNLPKLGKTRYVGRTEV